MTTLTMIAAILLTLAGCAVLCAQDIANAKISRPAPVHNFPRSGKHIRHTVWTDRFTVTYYGHSGRKVTSVTYPMSRYRAVLQSARNKGYRVI